MAHEEHRTGSARPQAGARQAAAAAGRGVARGWRRLELEQKAAALAALLLALGTIGPFSWIEGAELVVALAVLLLLAARARGATLRVPFGDGTAIAAAGAWGMLLILLRMLDRPLGQTLLALACAAVLLAVGVTTRSRERRRPGMGERPEGTTP